MTPIASAIALVDELVGMHRLTTVEAGVFRRAFKPRPANQTRILPSGEVVETVSPAPIPDVATLLRALGGFAAVGRMLSIGDTHPRSFMLRGSIPIRYWPDLIEGASAMGVRIDEADLLRISLASRQEICPASSEPEPA